MKIVIECDEYIQEAAGRPALVDLVGFRTDIECRDESRKLANEAVDLALRRLKGGES